jgi:4-amino-4-deoxy-L-arabinose transferase-like glycosyltransferase
VRAATLLAFAPAYAPDRSRRRAEPGSAEQLRRGFFLLLLATLAFRLWLAAVLPITGDEAYFIEWGRWPDWGFYDHPPMIGWWLALLLQVSEAPWWLRLPLVVQPALLALALRAYLAPRDAAAAWLAATMMLLAPAGLLGVAITTDTPLIYFSVFSALAFLRAARDDDPRWYFAAGLLLGGAFLSKYFAVLLGLAYAAHALVRPGRRTLSGLGLVVLGALPGPLVNLAWNMDHCWANVMFNALNRHGGAGLSWRTPALYAATLAYLLSPLAVLVLWRRRGELRALAGAGEMRALAIIGFVPLAIFAALSLVKTIGLHWLLSFVPFVLAAVALAATAQQRATLRRFFLGYAALHVAAALVVAALPVETWRGLRMYTGIVMTARTQEVLDRIEPFARDYVFAASGYSPAVTLSFTAKRYFPVFGAGSSHARHDDILTDWRPLDGRNILVLRKDVPPPADYEPYFHEVEYRSFEVRGARFHLVLGRGFRYATYREQVLDEVRRRWYAIPAWLPPGGCYFCERYFPERACRRS